MKMGKDRNGKGSTLCRICTCTSGVENAGYESVNEALAKMIPKAHEMGVKEGFDPFITLSFMALPVIPEIRITPRGIYLVNEDRMLRTPFS